MRNNSELIKKIISEQSDTFIRQAYDSWSELEIPLSTRRLQTCSRSVS